MPNPRYRLEIEALPATSGTPASRLRKALKLLGWYRLRVRRVEEVAADVAHLRQEERSPKETTDHPTTT
jgi:hypothetical protein